MFYSDVFPRNQIQVFSYPCAIYRCVTANMKSIKTQSGPSTGGRDEKRAPLKAPAWEARVDPTQAISPCGALGRRLV